MRKLILISALLLASASAQAGESRGLVLAATTDTPAVTTADALPQPLPPVAKTETKTETKTDVKAVAKVTPKVEAKTTPKAIKSTKTVKKPKGDDDLFDDRH